MNWKQTLEAALKAARDIAQKARDENRALTALETKTFDEHMAKANQARAKLAEIGEADARFKALADIDDSFDPLGGNGMDGPGFAYPTAKAGQVLTFKGLADQVKANMANRGGFRIKALLGADSQVTPAQTLTSPVVQGKPATGLLDLLPVRFLEGGDEYSYLTQTTRTNNAAPVAAGALKPTSVYTLTRVSRKLEVIAHLSEPIPEHWLADEPALRQFVTDEMAYGLQVAVEAQVLNGDGETPNLLGVLETSGIQVQAYNTSQIRTVRSAITKVETLGYQAGGLALNPLDWEAIETAADGEDRYFLTPEGSPVDRAARRLWGVPVALTTQVTQGTGVLLSEGSVGIVSDRLTNMQWGRVGDDFARNQVRARFEGRFGVECFHPIGVVSIALEAD